MVTKIPPTVLSLFYRVRDEGPNKRAVEDGQGRYLTYSQLDEKSSQLASHLLQIGTIPGQPIPLLTSSCIDMVVGVLGILKAKATYVPIDRERWPQERINDVLSRCNASIVVYTGDKTVFDHCRAVHLPLPERHGEDSGDCKQDDSCADIMCIIFTSGTTGRPKGVKVRSSAVATFASSPGFNYDVRPGDRVLLVLSVAFDACMGTMFNTLCNGGVVMLANGLNFQHVARTCNVLVVTPSILESFSPPESATDYAGVQRIILGGETPSRAILDDWSILNIPLWVAYGPTEATCAVLTQCLTHSGTTNDYHPNQFSRCIPGGEISLMREGGKSVDALGQEEEIWISGNSLAAGYWMDEDLTRERFVSHRGTRYYRTGDLGKWVIREDGTRAIELCGRRDRVTKIRGFQVNLDLDVDAALLQLDTNIRTSFSLVIDQKLCTAFIPHTATDEKALLAKWRLMVPPYMVPDHVFAMDHLPLTPSAKVDPKAVSVLLRAKLYKTPTSQTIYKGLKETVLAGISSVLDVSPSAVALTDSLVSQGMHSLAAAKLSSFCRRHGYNVPVHDIMVQPSVEHLIAACRSMTSKPGVMLDDGKQDSKSNDVIPFQKKMILASMQDPRIYRVKHIVHYRTDQIPRLMKAWATVVSSETAFQLEFQMDGANLVHRVDHERGIMWDERTVLCSDDVTFEINELDHETGLRSIFRVLTFQGPHLPRNESMLIWSAHHALIDGFSASLVFDRVDDVLRGCKTVPSPPYSLVVHDLARWQASIAREAEQLWSEQEDRCPAAVGELLINKPTAEPGAIYSTHVAQKKVDLDLIIGVAQGVGVTPAAIFYTAWALVLATYNQSDTVVFGAVFSGRNLPFSWAQTFIGALINTLPLRMKIQRSEQPAKLLQDMHGALQALSAICLTSPPRGGPRISTALVVQESGLNSSPTAIAPLQDPHVEGYVDLPLTAVVEPDGRVKFHYDAGEISAGHVNDVASVFLNTIEGLADRSLSLVKDVFDRQLPTATRESLLEAGNLTSPKSRIEGYGETIISRFFKAAALAPKNVAVEKDGQCMTYTTLERSVKQVGQVIQALVPAGATVAVLADRSINWIVGMFGALAANTIYCPIDSSYAVDYQAELLRRSTAKLLLVPKLFGYSKASDGAMVILGIDEILALNIAPTACCLRVPSPCDKAYLCFTSGSTGKPKGVLCEHRGVVAFHSSPETTMHSAPGRRIAQFLSSGFDGCVQEILSTICFGGTLVLRKQDNDPFSHLTNVDVAMLNPSVAAHLSPVDYPNLQYLYLCGEPLPQPSVDRWAPGRVLYNVYGPTETTIAVCLNRMHARVPVSLGPPLPTARIYILNDHLELQPPGVVGNIYVGGVQVGAGYLDMPDLTEREFIRDPFATWSQEERMYRTGDVGFWDESGNVHCCGRKDRQVKLHGYRINLDDIAEVAYQQMPQIRACVATVEKELVVLWVEPDDVCVSQLDQRLRTHLPPHAVPRRIRPIERIPVSKNGKLDVKSLASRKEDRIVEVIPGTSNALRQTLVNEWRILLGLSPSIEITGSDSFIGRGGDSVLQLSLAARVKKIFGVVITPKDIIEARSLDDMVALVERLGYPRLRNNITTNGPHASPLGLQRLSSAELWWLHRYRNSQCQAGFNVPYVANLSSTIDRGRLASALKIALNRHRILRSRFLITDGGPKRIIVEAPIDISVASSVDISTFINRPFNLAEEHPVRAVVTPECLALSISHIVCDLTSLRSLLRDTAALYQGNTLPALSREYFDTTLWSQPMDEDTAQFWAKELGDLDPSLIGKGNKATRSYRGTSIVTPVPTSVYRRLVTSTRKAGVTLHQIGLTVTALALHVVSMKESIVLGAPFINRSSMEDQDVVGLFLEPLPVRVRVADPQRSIADLVSAVHESSQAALANAVPWSTLVEHLGLCAQTGSAQIFDCVVTFHDDRTFAESLAIDGVSTQNVWTEGSKFAMLFEWHALPDRLSLRIEYDTDRFAADFVRVMRDLLLNALELILIPEASQQDAMEQLRVHLTTKCRTLGINVDDIKTQARTFLTGPWR
ncbi:hypothetical protein BDV24DRAFT_176994 [Aspergillus arachidicola]|uniref:Carrier domain-containing protein n=1 Tax=Aspergillus arachidicola TaxID=656916 RepID=A0A5N6YN97_9EURO|nr:hypothetical protein BDV24DRAFT_176994 [Aspergillus arachidicola]